MLLTCLWNISRHIYWLSHSFRCPVHRGWTLADAVVADTAVVAAITDAVSGFYVVVALPFLSVFVVAHTEVAVVECTVDFPQPAVFVVDAVDVVVDAVDVAVVVVQFEGPVVLPWLMWLIRALWLVDGICRITWPLECLWLFLWNDWDGLSTLELL